MDIADRASDLEMAERDHALANARAAARGGLSSSHCLDCGEPIPLLRQHAVPGVTFCIDCQTDHERRGKTFT